ncbi:MAG: tripartite tricarboxylate transporter substrate-binding protein [Microbacterium sp.]
MTPDSPSSEPEKDPLGQPLGAVYTTVVGTQSRTPKIPKVFGRIVFAVVAVASIGTATAFSFIQGNTGSDPRSSLTLIAPAAVGGGWDSFAREQQQAMRAEGIAHNVQVVNIPGAGGTIGLSSFTNMDETTGTLLATGAAMTGGIELNDSTVSFDDVRPVARVAEDYSIVIVAGDAPWDSIDDFVADWQANPSGMRFTGGSAGSIDHLIIAQFALVSGLDASEITYIPKSGGGEAMQTLFSGTADVVVTGYNEVADQIEAGRVKPIAISAPERLDGVDIPTFEELGYEVNLVNWRGFVASKNLTDEEFETLKSIVKETVQSDAWAEALVRNKWVDSYLDGDEFDAFIQEDVERTSKLVEELGL